MPRPNRPKIIPKAKLQAVKEALRGQGDVVGIAAALDVPVALVERVAKEQGYRSAALVGEGSKVVAVRLSDREVAALDVLMEQHGFKSRSELMRAVVRSASGMLEFSGESGARLEALERAVSKLGVNVNQIARAANKGRFTMGAESREVLHAVRRVFASQQAELRDIVAEKRRRGIRGFEAFLKGQGDG